MPKLKTKSSAKKRFSLTASGKIKVKHRGKRHNMRKLSQRQVRQLRKTSYVHKTNERLIKEACNLTK